MFEDMNKFTNRALSIYTIKSFKSKKCGVSVKRGPDTCGWRMRVGKCGWKKKMRIAEKVTRKKKRNVDGKKNNKINKQTNKQRKEIFLSSRCHIVGPFTYIQNVMPIVDTVILYPVIPFINVSFECLA